MIRSRLGLLGICAMVLGLMAFSAGSAQAAKWLIGTKTGEELKAELQGEIENADAALLSKILGIKVRILCTAGTLVGVSLEGAGKLTTGGKVQFTGCKTFLTPSGKAEEENKSCEPRTIGTALGTVETNKGKGQLVLHEATAGLTVVEPETGTAFATLEMSSTCPIGERIPVNGKLFLKDCTTAVCEFSGLETLKATHLIAQGPLTQLWVLNKNAEHLETSIDGSARIWLAGVHLGMSWSGMPE